MPDQGRLTEWNDERGFGFVTPLGGDQRFFAHISEFPRDLRRPELNDLVTFDRSLDERGRSQAVNVRFLAPAHAKVTSTAPAAQAKSLLVAAGFFVTLVALAVVGQLPLVIVVFYALMSALLFGTYAQDKAAAQSGKWRTSEATLHLMALLGGWPGALLAQGVFHHKTRKQPFRAIFYVTVAANCALLILVVSTTASLSG